MKRDEDWTAFPVYFINGFVVGILIPVNGWGKEQTQRNKSLKVKEWMESYLQQNKKGKRGFKRGSLSFILSLFGIALVHIKCPPSILRLSRYCNIKTRTKIRNLYSFLE